MLDSSGLYESSLLNSFQHYKNQYWVKHGVRVPRSLFFSAAHLLFIVHSFPVLLCQFLSCVISFIYDTIPSTLGLASEQVLNSRATVQCCRARDLLSVSYTADVSLPTVTAGVIMPVNSVDELMSATGKKHLCDVQASYLCSDVQTLHGF